LKTKSLSLRHLQSALQLLTSFPEHINCWLVCILVDKGIIYTHINISVEFLNNRTFLWVIISQNRKVLTKISVFFIFSVVFVVVLKQICSSLVLKSLNNEYGNKFHKIQQHELVTLLPEVFLRYIILQIEDKFL
jgi:uncharacterized membrane protein